MKIVGLQKLNRDAIDEKAKKVLETFDPDYFKYLHTTPINNLVDYLKSNFTIPFELEAQLGFDERGDRILGCYVPSSRSIYIDVSLKNLPTKYNFVLAHELGHLVLHRKCLFEDSEDEPLLDQEHDISGKKKLITDRDFMEWQANYFGSALLLPKNMIITKILSEKTKMGLRRSHIIYVDNQSCNLKDYFMLQENIANYFGVSKAVLDIRLKDLKLLNDQRVGYGLRSIQDILGEIGKEDV